MDVFAPQQRIVPVIVTIILERFPWRIRLCGIVACRLDNRYVHPAAANRRPRIVLPWQQMQVHLALQMDGETEIGARWKDNHSASGSSGGFDRPVHGIGVQGLAIADRAKGPNIEDALCGCSRILPRLELRAPKAIDGNRGSLPLQNRRCAESPGASNRSSSLRIFLGIPLNLRMQKASSSPLFVFGSE